MSPLRLGPKHSRAQAVSLGLGMSLPLLIISLILLVTISLFCFMTWREYVKSANQTRAAVALISSLKECVLRLQETENDELSLLLIGDPGMIPRGQSSLQSASSELSSLGRLATVVPNRAIPLKPFSDAANNKLHELTYNLLLIQKNQVTIALAAQKISQRLRYMDRIRSLERLAEEGATRQLASTRMRSRHFARLSQLAATIGSAGIFTIVLLSTIRIRRLLLARSLLTVELQRTNEDLQQFVYSASHDLQEPLRNLMVYSELLERRSQAGDLEGVREDVKSIRLFAARMRALVSDLLIYAQLTSSEAEPARPVDMNEVVSRVIEGLALSIKEAQARITSEPLPELGLSETHAAQLMQNLLSNAIKYRKPGVSPEIHIGAAKFRSEWVLSVRDNGIGIEPRYHSQIFGLFKRLHTATEYPGTGLGLAICRKVIEQHRGRMWVESQPQLGSTFYFSMPVPAK